jgi:hypothetical protein
MTICAVSTDESEQSCLTHTHTPVLLNVCVRDMRLVIPLCGCRANLYTSIRITTLCLPVLISRCCAAPVMIDDHVVRPSGPSALAPVKS